MKNPPKTDFEGAYAGLRRILEKYSDRMFVAKNGPRGYYLETKCAVYKGKPLAFAAVAVQKRYVSFHLMCVYMNPKMLKSMSPELKKRMQGKACFNFTAPDKKLFAELAKMTEAGIKLGPWRASTS